MHFVYLSCLACLTTLSHALQNNHAENFISQYPISRAGDSRSIKQVSLLEAENDRAIKAEHLSVEFDVEREQRSLFDSQPLAAPKEDDIVKEVRKLLGIERNFTKLLTLENRNSEAAVKLTKPVQRNKFKPPTARLDGEQKLTEISKNGVIENHLTRRRGHDTGESPLRSFQSSGYTRISPSPVKSVLNETKPFVRPGESSHATLDNSMSLVSSSTGTKSVEERVVNSTWEETDSIQVGQHVDIQPKEEDIIEAANIGMQAMNNLYYIIEPNLFSKGIFLGPDNPARYVAAFNDQTEEARKLARFAYAALEGAKAFRQRHPEISRHMPLSIVSRKTDLHRQCPKRSIPQCPPASLKYRTADGSCNNLQELLWGSSMSTMQRFMPPVYQDGIETVRVSVTGAALPSARDVSSIIHQDRDIPLASVTHMLMQWGQFVDHDITATGQSRGFNGTVPQCCLNGGAGLQPPEFMHPECLPIAVNPRDNFYGHLGIRCLEFLRSGPAPREDCGLGPREQLSQVTSYLDASTVYSSNVIQSDSLRTFRNGLLQYGRTQARQHVLPRENSDICRLGALSTSCFKSGDGRLSEQPALTSLHIVFVRLHNKIATQLAIMNRHWSDERIFQETRKIVGAIVQHITYREFLPIILGPAVMAIFDLEVVRRGFYEGYDPNINPNIANAFSTAAYRFGHSLVQNSFVRFDREHCPIFNNVSIHDEFSNPVNLLTAGSVERVILGLINQPSQRRDEFIVNELTNHLFQTPGFSFGMDLASLNIQRGRDHGLPPYVAWRVPCGLTAIQNWEDLEHVTSTEVVRKLRVIYASVEDVDLFTAGLSEKPVGGGLVGPTFACIIAQQFSNLRKGDRFWYENPHPDSAFTPAQLQQIKRMTLSEILCSTLDDFDSVQPFVFLSSDRRRNRRRSCKDPFLSDFRLDPWRDTDVFDRHEDVVNEEEVEEDKDVFVEFDGDEAISRAAIKKDKPSGSHASQSKPSQSRMPPIRQRPLKTKINQQNRIIVTRPLTPHENMTIFVQNNAVNAPIFVNDAHISDSSISINQLPTTTSKPPLAIAEHDQPAEQQGSPIYAPVQVPKPISNPQPYVPQNFNDANNPNPPHYGFNANPFNNNYLPNNAYFNSHPNVYNPSTYQPPYQQHTPPTGVYTNQQVHDTFNYNENSGNVQKPLQTSYGTLATKFTGKNQDAFAQNEQNIYNTDTVDKNNDEIGNNKSSVQRNHYDPVMYVHARQSTELFSATDKNTSAHNSNKKNVNNSSLAHDANGEINMKGNGSQDLGRETALSDEGKRTEMNKHALNEKLEGFKETSQKTYNVVIITEGNEANEKTTANKQVRPAAPQLEKGSEEIIKPGLYYYDRNVLRRYPQKVQSSVESGSTYRSQMASGDETQTSGNKEMEVEHVKDSKAEVAKVPFDSVARMESAENENDFVMTRIILGAEINNNKEESFISEIGNMKENDDKNDSYNLTVNRKNESENYFEEYNFMEMPTLAPDNRTTAAELPKPIKLAAQLLTIKC